ncbi:hypothetical protein K435DRAFT_213413 [Dendrothele bispora CBS 962.96]|uniref:Uncharacterized protein n=1 Tax=Dendrothele bispora (strain CBS 962.96) TaxID=1314807 RepID=A0A4S8LS22_DENBC|nr:hypothetical protein K435DRAFT_289456 [Dendrothele bispora CBS 962.96]THU92276.1 hypothetical protein K435DRAFT_213413 [Dendrothele bispora CBS 962.96]
MTIAIARDPVQAILLPLLFRYPCSKAFFKVGPGNLVQNETLVPSESTLRSFVIPTSSSFLGHIATEPMSCVVR